MKIQQLFERCRRYHGPNLDANRAALLAELRVLIQTPEGAALIETLRDRVERVETALGDERVYAHALQMAHWNGKREALAELIDILQSL